MKILLAIILSIQAAGCVDFTSTVVKDTKNYHHTDKKSACKGKPVTIAVIDTGFGYGLDDLGKDRVKLCKYGHKNFASESYSKDFNTVDSVPIDNHGHGTNIAGIIDKYAKEKNINYCLVIIEYFDPFSIGRNALKNTIMAINYATSIKADFINYSGGGIEFNDAEANAVKKFLDTGGKFIAAAGNEHSDLAVNPYYPAMTDDRVIVVGNLNGVNPAKSSNFGDRINYWENGTGIASLGIRMTGTSQSAAIITGKLVGETKNFCK